MRGLREHQRLQLINSHERSELVIGFRRLLALANLLLRSEKVTPASNLTQPMEPAPGAKPAIVREAHMSFGPGYPESVRWQVDR